MKEYSISIRASQDEIFTFLTDREKIKEWAIHLEDIIPENPDLEMGVGYKFIERDNIWGIRKEYHDEVYEYEKDKTLGVMSTFKDKTVKFRYILVPDDSTVKEKDVVLTPMVNENFQESGYYENITTEEKSQRTKVILQVWIENRDGSPETVGEKALDYFLAKEGIAQLRKLKNLIEDR